MKSSNFLGKFSRQCLILYQQEEWTNLSQINKTTATTISTTAGADPGGGRVDGVAGHPPFPDEKK